MTATQARPETDARGVPRTTVRFGLSPRALSVSFMVLSTGLHFAAYELARSATLAIFTSKTMGYESSSVLSLAVGCVSPFSILLLATYSSLLDRAGPRSTLLMTTSMFAIILTICSLLFVLSQSLTRPDIVSSQYGIERIVSRTAVFVLFVYQNASVRLIHSQHWSFLSSVLTQKEAHKWFAPITGFASLTSTVAAGGIAFLLNFLSLPCLLILAAAAMLIGGKCSDSAYEVAARYNFTPQKETNVCEEETSSLIGSRDQWNENVKPLPTPNRSISICGTNNRGLIRKAQNLFLRVPILKILFVEVLLCQSLSSLLNFALLIKTKEAIPGDEDRASWSGQCYAWSNGISGILQFFFVPLINKVINPSFFWISMPASMLLLILYQCLEPSLFSVGLSFFWMKTQEYSFRPVVSELIYVTMDYDSRFLGKEIVNLFADRLGKSMMALALFAATTNFEEKDLLGSLATVAFVVCCIWLLASLHLLRSSGGRAHTKHSEETEQ